MESRDASHTSEKPHPKAIVCLYAQRDEARYRELQTYLVLWQNQGHIYWADPASIQQADLILLLLSPDFFAARRCQREMVRAFEARTERGIPVVPVLARASNWQESACGALKALPDNDRPIAEWRPKERAYENICAGLARVLPDLPALGIAPPEGLSLFQAPKLPESYVARPNEFAAIKQLLLHQQGIQETVITTALRGAGGFGKTTLAQAVCHDPEIQAAFPDGILWVELGERPPRPRDVLNGLLASLEPSRAEEVTLEEAKKRWRAALQDRVYLLVIDDVWQAEALLPLLEGGPSCQRLVTTRNDLLLPRDATRVLVDAMEPQEAVSVLCQGLPESIHQATHLESLVERLGYWPLLLTLANGLLTDLVDAHLSLAEALATVTEAYETRGIMAFRLDNVEERQRTVDACMSVSLRHLEQFTPPHYHATERYQELAVFPEDTDIPLPTLQLYWRGSAKLELWETKDLCIRLRQLSLLLTCDLGRGIIRLHDVVRAYLIQRSGDQVPQLHAHFLDAIRQGLTLTHWAEIPLSNQYLWQHLLFHLCQAKLWPEVAATLVDLRFLAGKVHVRGVADLEGDLAQVAELALEPARAVPPTGGGIRQELAFLPDMQRQVGRLSNVLRQSATLEDLRRVVLISLGWREPFAAQQHLLAEALPPPYLIAWHPFSEWSSSLLRTLFGHTKPVLGCAMSANGRVIVSASYDGTLKVWDAVTGEERHTLSGHTNGVLDCAVSADGRVIVSALASSYDGTLKVWDATTGEERHTLKGYAAGCCAVSADGRVIISASASSYSLQVWDAATGAHLRTLHGHRGGVLGCAVSADGRVIVSTSYDDTLKVWDAATGVERWTLRGHTGAIYDCAVSADGRVIVSTSSDGTLKVWDATTGEERHTLKGYAAGCCAVSADGRVIVSASNDGTLKVWDATTGAERCTLKGHTSSVNDCAMSADGRFIVSASEDHTLKVWDATTGEERRAFRGHTDQVSGCAVSADGRVIVSASQDKTLKVWDAITGAERRTLSGHTGGVLDCAVSANGQVIVSASQDKTLKVWDAAGKERRTLRGHASAVMNCAVSANGRVIVSTSSDGTLKVWDVTTGKERHTLNEHSSSFRGCAVSADGRVIVSAWASSYTLTVWEATTRKVRRTRFIYAGAFITSCAMSADGKWIVSASSNGTLKVWDAVTGKERHTLSGHTSSVTVCGFSPDGRFLVSASSNGTLKVWELATGQCVLTFPVEGAFSGCAFHPDGEHLVACGTMGIYFLRLVV